MNEFDATVILTRCYLLIKKWHDQSLMKEGKTDDEIELSWQEYIKSNDMKPIMEAIDSVSELREW